MTLLIISFVAGVLTILAPCVLPLIPVIIGGSLSRSGRSWGRPIIITASLAVSIVIFTLLLKASTLLLGVPTAIWQVVSGLIIILFGLSMLFPKPWEEFMIRSRLQAYSSRLLGASTDKRGVRGDILLGVALGPVFSSCSPTFALIIAAVLPASIALGVAYLVAYAIGLSISLLLVILLGQSLITKLGWALNPHGVFIKIMGGIFIMIGIALIFGLDKVFQSWILDQGWYAPIEHFEMQLRR